MAGSYYEGFAVNVKAPDVEAAIMHAFTLYWAQNPKPSILGFDIQVLNLTQYKVYDKAKKAIGKLDVDANPVTADRFQVFSIPTMIIFKNGSETERLVGLCPKTRIADTLKKHSE